MCVCVCVLCQVSDSSVESSEAEDNPVPERFQVRRLSSRTLQLPPLAFRQAEQFDWKESEQTSRPATLAPSMPPLIAITLADSNRSESELHHSSELLSHTGIWYYILQLLLNTQGKSKDVTFRFLHTKHTGMTHFWNI